MRDEIAGFSTHEHEFQYPTGHENAIVGVVERIGMDPVLCIDREVVLANLEAEGMTPEEAIEWFEFNILGAWMGDSTPCYLTRDDKETL